MRRIAFALAFCRTSKNGRGPTALEDCRVTGVRLSKEEVVSWRPEVIEVAPPPVSKELKKRWSYFIRKVYEADPLTCPRCQGEMRIISFIDQPEVKKSFNT